MKTHPSIVRALIGCLRFLAGLPPPENTPDPRQYQGACESHTYHCRSCGALAATVTLVPPGQPDPRLTPEPEGVPPGISTVLDGYTILSVGGCTGSASTALLFPNQLHAVLRALEIGTEAALYAVDPEFTPFWCPSCQASYCREHYKAWPVLDGGHFDCLMGVCPQGHERMLLD